jgi:hypothetical protein
MAGESALQDRMTSDGGFACLNVEERQYGLGAAYVASD